MVLIQKEAIGSYGPLKISGSDDVYPILMQKQIDIILGAIAKLPRTSLALRTLSLPELLSYQHPTEMDTSN